MSNSDSFESQSEREIFFEALGKSAKKERADFLDGACLGHPELRRRIEALLANHAEHDSFMEETALDVSVTLPDAADLSEKTGSVIDRFRLLEKLGEGGFGSVWAAEQKEPVRRRVALKIIKLGMDTKQVVARFEAERQALALMDHPNIAKVLDAGATDTGRPYFVMELVKGIAITKYCEQEKLDANERLDLFIKSCQAIQHAHQKGIIHRDIKPSNIMVTLHDGVPVPKVIDFGIAKATQQELTEKTIYTQYNQFIGTPAYMSPEQAEMSGLDIDTRSDIYSLGVLLYELLTGSTPFDAKELMHSGLDEMRKIIREREPVRPSTKLSQTLEAAEVTRLNSTDDETVKVGVSSSRKAGLPQIPSDLDWIVMKCLEKDRSRRYDSANGLAADLKRHLNDEPVTACPPTPAYRFQKAFRRNKLVFTAGAAVFAALVIGVSVSTWQTIVARKAQRQADEATLAEQTNSRELVHEKAEAIAAREATEYANYVSLVRLAAANLKQGNRVTAQDALLSTAPKFRNWEWSHLVNEAWPADAELNTWTARDRDPRKTVADFWRDASVEEIARHVPKKIANMNAIAFQQDRGRVVTSPNDAAVHIWDIWSEEERIIDLKKGLLTGLAVSHDYRFIAAGDAKGNTTLLYADSGEREWSLPSSTRKPIDKIWFSRNGKHVVTGNFDGWIEVRDTESGRELTSFTNHLETVSSVQFGKDGKSVLTASQDGTIRYWELATGHETLPAMLAPYTGKKGISVQAINPANSREIATGDFDGEVFLWDRDTGKRLSPDIPKGSDEISHLVFSSDGSCLFVVEGRDLIRVVDRSSGEDLARIASADRFHRFTLNEENARIVTASPTSITSVWAPVRRRSYTTPTLARAHDDIVTQAAFSPDGRLVITASYDQTAKIWDTSTEELVAEFKGHTNELLYAAFSTDGKRAVSVSSRGKFRVWDWESGTGRELFHQEVHSQRFFKSASPRNGIRDMLLEYVAGFAANPFSPTSSKLVVTDGQRMLVRDGVTGEELFPLMGSTNVGWPQISPSGDRVAVMNDTDKNVNVWDLNTGQLNHTLVGHKGKAFWAAFSHDSSKLVTGSMDSLVIVWDANKGTELSRFKFINSFVAIARFSPDDQRIAIAGNDTVALIWNLESGDKSLLKGPEQRITNIEFNPNLSIDRVLTTSVDNTVRIWDPTGPNGREVLQITRNSKLIYATWNSDGTMILTCWKDGVVQLHKTVPLADFANVTDAVVVTKQIRRWRQTRLQ